MHTQEVDWLISWDDLFPDLLTNYFELDVQFYIYILGMICCLMFIDPDLFT